MKKRILSIIICIFLLFSLTACGGENFVPSQKPINKDAVGSVPSENQIIAQNSKYSLEYIAEEENLVLADAAGETVWEVCPTPTGEVKLDDFGLPIKRNSNTQSTLLVHYIDKQISGGGNMVTNSYDGATRKIFKEIKNGITIEYYFDNLEFMIPVDYVLCDDYLSVSINTKNIQETSYEITQVSLTPFICAVENDMPDSYLFYPSGSGALVDNKSIGAQGVSYSAYVYGDDLTMEEEYIATNETPIRMPVYGYKTGEKGGVAIIDKGADTALLVADSGSTLYAFSAVYPTFQLRGRTDHLASTFSNTEEKAIYPNNMIEGTVSIRFYPLNGENANYTGMANVYRNYLIKEHGLTANKNEKALSVSLIGGTMITKSFLGIPYQTLYPTTTIDQAGDIITDISKDIKDIAVKLNGFGTTGVDAGKIGGGFKLGDTLGNKKDLADVSNTCSDKKIDLYMDYDLIKFSSTGSGFSNFSDVAMNCGYIKSDQFIIDKALRNNEEKLSYRLLRPIKFNDAVSKALESNNNFKVNGIALDTLSSISYSDYSDYNATVDYNSKHKFSDAVANSISQIKKSKQKFMAYNANAYAAVVADIISDTPISSDNGYAFIEDVPFYSMVFKGYIPMTTESINLSADTNKAILGAVESGIGLNYTLISQWDNSLIDALYPEFYSTVYKDVKKDIVAQYNSLAGYYNSIKGAKIVSSTILSQGVHCTTFDNGVTVYVNYNNFGAQTPAGDVSAYSYIVSGGVVQ